MSTPRQSQHAALISGEVVPKYAGLPTFMRLPIAALELPPDVVILGAPFDGGSTVRPGSRFAPRAVREVSTMLRPYNPGFGMSPFSHITVADAGDVSVNPLDLDKSLAAITREVGDWAALGARAIVIGGDHLVTLGVLRGLSAMGPYAVVHLDAHSDTEDEFFGSRYNHGTVFRRALEEGTVAPDAFFQIGLRGTTYDGNELDYAKRQGLSLYTCDEADALGAGPLAERIREKTAGRPIYLSIDIDAIDPAFAPGTGTPEVAGLDVKFCLRLLRQLGGLRFAAADVVEVSPPYDIAMSTSQVAAHLIFEQLCLMALSPRNHV